MRNPTTVIMEGVILDIDKLLRETNEDDDYKPQAENKTGDYDSKNGTKYMWAIKGNVLSIEDVNTTYTGVAALYTKDEGKFVAGGTRGVQYSVSAYYTGTFDAGGETGYPNLVYVWYINFDPVD